MDDKNKLTGKLKLVETEIYQEKIDLKAIEAKLKIAYDYEEELIARIIYAKKKSAELKSEFFKKVQILSNKFGDMKNIFDVFTGNFYRDI